MIDYDYCEQMAMAEAMPIIAKATENVPQKAEASEMIRHYISVGVRLMKVQIFTQEMESIIKWQTGMPEQSGRYLVTLSTGEVTVMECYNPYTSSPYWLDEEEEEGEVVAWCDFESIEPYKEITDEE